MANSRRQTIEELSLVAKIGSRPLFAGWTSNGLPIISASSSDLSSQAKSDFQILSRSGFRIPELDRTTTELEVVVASMVGPLQDIKDHSPRELVEDTIILNVIDAEGESYQITLGELEILEMLSTGMLTYQKLGTIMDTPDRQEAVEIMSFFLPGSYGEPGVDDRPDLLLLLKPTNDNFGNLIDVVLFMSEIIQKLIANDRKQPAPYRKGYIEAEKAAENEIFKQLQKEKGVWGFFYEPESVEESKSTLKELITDLFYEPIPGQKAQGGLLQPSETKRAFTVPTKENLRKLRMIASKMFLFAKSKLR